MNCDIRCTRALNSRHEQKWQTISHSDIPPESLGETGALSLKPPTEEDLRQSAALEEALTQMDVFESREEMHQRREALSKLQEMSNRWIYKKAVEQSLPEHIALSTTGKIFTFVFHWCLASCICL
ncbi:unnamed protein product [Mesocestoides corti]|uniref:Polynucleotide adenylyltransferase n=1 Tax=Mesocestoides corti TaxID=53468 RepID=A0A0R3UCP8_MESCO|nr:unnamed protein product [Mesocestoides corti]